MSGDRKKTCFIVSAIGSADSDERIHGEDLRDTVIDPVFKELGSYKIVRADEIPDPGLIDAQIIRHLIDDDLVIADLTFLNPNVFYELGIRHVIAKPIIHMFRSGTIIPFDVKAHRAIEFSITRSVGRKNAQEALRQAVIATQSDQYRAINPVTNARAIADIQIGKAPSADQFLLEKLDRLETKISVIEQRRRNEIMHNGVLDQYIQHGDLIHVWLKMNLSEEEKSAAIRTIFKLIYESGISVDLYSDIRNELKFSVMKVNSTCYKTSLMKTMKELSYVESVAISA